MVFVFTFAVGGGSGKVIPMPNWALVSFVCFTLLFRGSDLINIYRIRLEIQIIVKDSHSPYLIGGPPALFQSYFFAYYWHSGKSMFSTPSKQ